MHEQCPAVPPSSFRPREAFERRDFDFIDQVPQEVRLGQDLSVDEGRRRFERDGGQLVEPVQPTGGVDVGQRDRQDETPWQRTQPGLPRIAGRHAPAAHDVISVLNGFQERFQVRRRPGFDGRRNEHERQRGARQARLERLGEALAFDRDNALFHGTSQFPDVTGERLDDRLSSVRGQPGEQDNSNARARKRIAPRVLKKRIVAGLVGGHSSFAAVGGSSDSVGCGLAGQPLFDLVPIGSAQPLGNGAGAARSDRTAVDFDHG
jgi:hypothetical protein